LWLCFIIFVKVTATKKSHQVFVDHFKGQTTFTRQDVFDFFLSQGKELSDAALRWRIHDLKNAGIIKSVASAVYAIAEKPVFVPIPDVFTEKTVELFSQKYEGLNFCVWNTNILHSFMIHQPVNSFYVFETDRDITESVFYHFKAHNLNVFNNPILQMMDDYVLGSKDAVVLKPLVSRAPIQKDGIFAFPALEKILVDIFCDQHQFYVYGGHEMIVIFENAFNSYHINLGSMYNYAGRRGRRGLIRAFIEEHVKHEMIDK
jgi:hypothetical protein